MAISYQTTKISDSHYRLSENGVFIELIIGETSALLIDTGYGLGDLKSAISAITDKPYKVANTHGHPDHSCGNWQFNEVYVNPNDFAPASLYDCPEARAAALPEEKPDDFLDEYLTAPTGNMIPCNEGDIFDLGGIQIEVVGLPGHTAGSIGFLNRSSREIYIGDAANGGLFLFQPGISQHIDVYRATLNKLYSLPADNLWSGHNDISLNVKDAVELYRKCAKDIDFEKCIPLGPMLNVEDVRLWVVEKYRDKINKDDPLKSIFGEGLINKSDYASILCSKYVF